MQPTVQEIKLNLSEKRLSVTTMVENHLGIPDAVSFWPFCLLSHPGISKLVCLSLLDN